MIIYVDIDETICNAPESRDYNESKPIPDRIERINKLYEAGNTIVYWTARGSTTGIDWRGVTEKQFREWGVKYNELILMKPYYDLFIDDKNINSETFFTKEEEL